MSRRRLLSATVFLVPLAVLLAVGSGHETPSVSAGSADTEPLWTPDEWARARRFSPLPPPPADPTNALAEDLRAARLGHRLFFEARLSPHGVSCATCHNPAQGFTDGRVVAHTLTPLQRNTMTILNVGHYRWLTWDGARDSLWHQAIAPLENPHEMGSSRLYVVRAVMHHYAAELAEITALPAGWDALWPTLPTSGQPGEAAFDSLPTAQQEAVNRLFATIVKLIAAYERQIVSAPAPFDRFVAGDYTALSTAAQRGFQHFLRFQCDTCHNTPVFSDDEFHNLGLPSVPVQDQGRAEGLVRLQQSLFRGTGPYADGPPPVRAEDYQVGQALLGSFRTPSLRELVHTAPYGHNGTIATLEAWLEHYVQVTTATEQTFLGTLDATLPAIDISPQENQDLVAFLQALSSVYTSIWTQPPVALQGRGQ